MTDDDGLEWQVKTLVACMGIPPNDHDCGWRGAFERVTALRERHEVAMGLLRAACSGERLSGELRLRIQEWLKGEKVP